MNAINDEAKEQLAACLQRTNDDFGITLSGNQGITKDTIDYLHHQCQALHKKRVEAMVAEGKADASEDADIAIKRVAF